MNKEKQITLDNGEYEQCSNTIYTADELIRIITEFSDENCVSFNQIIVEFCSAGYGDSYGFGSLCVKGYE